MHSLLYCELLKLKRSKMLLISFLGALVTPAMMIADGVKIHFSNPEIILTLGAFYDNCSMYTIMLFGLIVYTVIGAYLFSREYSEKTLKTILAVPVSKSAFITAKFIALFLWMMALTFISWFSMFVLFIIFDAIFSITEFIGVSVALLYFGEMMLGGVLMFFTISPFVFLALRTKGLVVPIIAAAAVAMGNVALSNEDLGALFPWTSLYLLLKNDIAATGYPYPLVIGLIAAVSLFGFVASAYHFKREDVK